MTRVVHTVVFADGPDGGNPCPVVFDADELTTEEMQALAAREGHETCFVLQPQEDGDLRLRYFVPLHEMEMCVHATVAAAVLAGAAVVETPLGLRNVAVTGARAVVEQSAPVFGAPEADVGPVSDVLGAVPAGPVLSVSTARAKLMVPLADEAALDTLRPDFERLWGLCDALDVTGICAYTRTAEGADVAARQFPLRAGYDEDPATGVAACALGALLARDEGATGWRTYAIAQGRAMGRPSRIDAEALVEGETVVQTRVGGTMRLANT